MTKAACILPFEEALLRQHGVDATFVGHPLLDRAQSLPSGQTPALSSASAPMRRCSPCFRAVGGPRSGVTSDRSSRPRAPCSASAPTSRSWSAWRRPCRSIRRTAPSRWCRGRRSWCSARPRPGCSRAVPTRWRRRWRPAARDRLQDEPDHLRHRATRREDSHIGLVNVVAGREVSREFVQHTFVPETVASALLPLLEEGSAARHQAERDLVEVQASLGTPGASQRVAEVIVGMLTQQTHPAVAPGGGRDG